jgi:ATP-dependent RNA helicase DeaD
MDKEDIIKKIVSLEFGKFLSYYADAPEIEKPSGKGDRSDRGDRKRGDRGDRGGRGSRGGSERSHKPEAGYKRLFINLGKSDGFYPGEVMQFINKNVHGHQEVGHIDLLNKISYIEVPEKDAQRVMQGLDGADFKGRSVRCNDAEDSSRSNSNRGSRG